MRHAVVFVPIVAVLFVASCGGGRAQPVGVSDKAQGGTRDTPDAGTGFAKSDLPDNFRASYIRMNAAPFVSMGHAGGRWDADVYRSPGASKPTTATDPLPVGARIVMEHFERQTNDPNERKGPLFVMEKMPTGYSPDHGDLRYVVIAASGQTKLDGADPSCTGCHDDAPRERLFTLPSPTR